MIANNGVGQ